ncbi:MAG: hypothetical protein QW487_06035 [Candidatus Bathyarchaeia archaeon]|nr:hypothetical protein [Candidatus Bathyarchaeota archaeon]
MVTPLYPLKFQVKEKLKKLGLKPSKVLRKAIEDVIMEEEVKRLKESMRL